MSEAKITEIPEPIKTVEVQTSVPESSTEDKKIEVATSMVSSSADSSENKPELDQSNKSESAENK